MPESDHSGIDHSFDSQPLAPGINNQLFLQKAAFRDAAVICTLCSSSNCSLRGDAQFTFSNKLKIPLVSPDKIL